MGEDSIKDDHNQVSGMFWIYRGFSEIFETINCTIPEGLAPIKAKWRIWWPKKPECYKSLYANKFQTVGARFMHNFPTHHLAMYIALRQGFNITYTDVHNTAEVRSSCVTGLQMFLPMLSHFMWTSKRMKKPRIDRDHLFLVSYEKWRSQECKELFVMRPGRVANEGTLWTKTFPATWPLNTLTKNILGPFAEDFGQVPTFWIVWLRGILKYPH